MEINYENFEKYHEASLKSSAVPKRFWKKLYEKIIEQRFDAGEDFGLAENSEGDKGIPRNRNQIYNNFFAGCHLECAHFHEFITNYYFLKNNQFLFTIQIWGLLLTRKSIKNVPILTDFKSN